MPIMFLFGIAIEWAFIRRIKSNRVALSLLMTFAIAQVVERILPSFSLQTLNSFTHLICKQHFQLLAST